jgi:hypothetical protein
MALVPNLKLEDITNDDGIEVHFDDGIIFNDDDENTRHGRNTARKLLDYINLLPRSVEVVSKLVRITQREFYTQIRERYDKCPESPDPEWIEELEQLQTEINEKLGTETLPWGHVPLSRIGSLWMKSKGNLSVDAEKELHAELFALWVREQFPQGWTMMPPEDINTYPDQSLLQEGVDLKAKLERQWDDMKALSQSQDLSGQAQGTNGNASGTNNPSMTSRDKAIGAYQAPTVSGGTMNVPIRPKKQFLQLASRRVVAGKAIPNSNRTEDQEPIVSWFERQMVYKDDYDPKNKQAKKSFRFYVVQKETHYEIVGEELCGGRAIRDAVNERQVPRLCEGEALKKLPSRAEITKISWGLNWVAAKRKYKAKEGLPPLIVNMWWYAEAKGDYQEFTVGLGREKLDRNERAVSLSRGHYCGLMGPRGDKMIMMSIPRADGLTWKNVKECINNFLVSPEV